MRATSHLRALLARDRLLLAPFVYDGLTARLAEQVGFEAVYMTGFGTSMGRGYPDMGLLTQTEMVQNAAALAEVVNVPVIADADTGYGNAINVWRTVRLYERAGVAGIHLEDQVFPKRCGFFEGKRVISLEEAVQKIRSALDARQDPDFLIIARTDALAVHGWDEVVRRCRAFHQAGADMVFVDGVEDAAMARRYARDLKDLPRLYNGDILPADEAERLGFKLQIHRGPVFRAIHWFRGQMQELRDTGGLDPAGYPDSARLRDDIAALLGMDRIREMEQRYATQEA